MKNQVQLIAYVDRLSGGGLRELAALLEGPLAGLFGGVHLLPFFWPIDGADAGFDPIDHTKVDPRLGSWDDVRALGEGVDVMADLIVNHISTRSPQFLDFLEQGDASRHAPLFLTYARVFQEGASEEELLRIYRPRPGLPFTKMRLADGSERLLWTTFTSEQVDIDVRSAPGKNYLDQILERFQTAGIRSIRLDAAGYAIKKRGTSCFMIPETFEFIGELTERAHERGMEALVEIHCHYQEQIEIAKRVDWVYDFALPPLVLHTLYNNDTRRLREWLQMSPRNAVTVLDTHDGIGVMDVRGLLTPEEIEQLVATLHERSGGESLKATGAAASNLDLYQINCTYYDALGRRDEDYLLARAIQFFAPGIPQVYYVGLLAGLNDLDRLQRTGVGRDINRHAYTRAELERQKQTHVVCALGELIRFRNTHPAFGGKFQVHGSGDGSLVMEWRTQTDWARLEVELGKRLVAISHSSPAGEQKWALTGRGA